MQLKKLSVSIEDVKNFNEHFSKIDQHLDITDSKAQLFEQIEDFLLKTQWGNE